MGTAAFLCALVGCVVAARAEDGTFPPHHPGFFENLFRFEQDFDFPQDDTVFGSSRTWGADFHVLGELPSLVGLPRVEVFCDQSKFTVLVEKKLGGVLLTADELQLGDGCLSNQDLPNQHVFAYGVDECGTARAVEDGVEAFTNTLWIKPRARWPLPPSVSLTCIHNRAFSSPLSRTAHPDEGAMAIFNFRATDASWTGPAQSNVYQRGRVLHLQASVRARPGQQLFIQSCFISSSPEPHSRPRHAVIANKGCATLLDSSRSAVRFVASLSPDVVNVALNTSRAPPEPFVHCTVLVSDQGVTPGSKSCSYDAAQQRWEDPSGAGEPCECCSSRCRGLSLKNVPDEAKAVLSIGPFLVVDVEEAGPPPETPEALDADPMQPDGAAAVAWGGGAPGDAVLVSQDPAATLALWIPGELKDGLEPAGGRQTLTEERSEAQKVVHKRLAEHPQTGAEEFNAWVESPVKFWQAKFGLFGRRSAGEAGPPEVEVPNTGALPETRAGPVIRSKVEFSKGADGSQTLSYEEEVVRKEEDGIGGCGAKKRCRPGLRSKFLDLIRRLDEAE